MKTSRNPSGTGTPLSNGLLDNQMGVAVEPAITGPYSLTEIATVTAGSNSLTSLDAAIIDAPEPASLSLLGAALFALGMISPRRRSTADRREVVALK